MTDQPIRCQVCDSEGLESLLDLGCQPLCNEFPSLDVSNRPQVYYPLALHYCPNCTIVQLGYVLPTTSTFGAQYTYLTGSSPALVEFYQRMADQLVHQLQLQPGDLVLEIGSNDGTFLRALKERGLQVLGVEGAEVAATAALEQGIPTIPRFFGNDIGHSIRENIPESSDIKLIVAMNVLAHTDNLNDFLDGVKDLMKPDTAFVSSSHWLVELVRQFAFDTIYQEHLRYYTLSSLAGILGRHGLHVFDAEKTEFYGGSVLSFASTEPAPQTESMLEILKEEEQVNVIQSLRDMSQTMLKNKMSLLNLLYNLNVEGKRVAGIGAPMKSSTLLNYYGITSDLVQYLTEINPHKVGTAVPGVGIPVIEEGVLFEEQPEYALLLSWNMADHIIPKYRGMGYKGKFILPIPEPKVIE